MSRRLALVLLLLASPARAQTPAVELPSGAAADALARIGAGVAPAALTGAAGPAWPAWDAAEWDADAAWRRWSELVVEEAQAARPDAGRRAALALAAALQGRDVDAWEHFAASAAEPAIAAALLPRLFPGVPADAPLSSGGRPGALPDGVLLRPVLPPLWLDSPLGRPRVRSMRLEGLAIGAAVCDLALKVEEDGVEVAFEHRSGGAARVRVVLPLPHDRELRSLYVDWERVAIEPVLEGRAIELALEPLDPAAGTGGEASIWARVLPRDLAWPTPGERIAMSAQVRRGGIALAFDPGDPLAPRLARLADALGVVLGVPSVALERDRVPPPARLGTPPLLIAFRAAEPEPLRRARLAFLASAAERYALAR